MTVGQVGHSFEQGALDRIVRKGRLDGDPRDGLQFTLPKAEALARDGILAADASAEVRWIVGAQRHLHARFVQLPQWVRFVTRRRRASRRWTSDRPPARSRVRPVPPRAHGSSIARTPCDMRVIGSVSASRTDSAPACSPAWTVQPSPDAGGDLVGAGELRGGVARLVARQVEADDVLVAVLGERGGRSPPPPRRRSCGSSTTRMRRLDARCRARVVDALGDPAEVLGVRQPDRRRVIGRGEHLHVDARRRARRTSGTRR